MIIFSRVLSIFILMVAGYVARKAKAVDADFVRGLSGFILNVAIPFTIIVGFDRSIPHSALPDLAMMALWAVVLHGATIAASAFFYRKAPESKRKVLSYVTVFSNCGFMGFPVAESAFGKVGVMYTSIYVVVFQIFLWTYGVSLFSGGAVKGQARKVLLNPGNLSIIVGFILWFLPFDLPGAVQSSIVTLSQMTTPLSMIVVGATLADIPLGGLLKGKELWIGALVRILVVPAAVYGAMRLFGVNGLPARIAAFLTAMPAAAQTVIFAERYKADVSLASRMVFLSTILCVGTIPFFAMILK